MHALREMRRKARRDLRTLLRVPPEERPDKIFSARSRYRSRAFAELLLEEARRRVKDDPRQARQLAALVPEVLHWVPGAGGQPWRQALEVLARAHEANALRVAGDLVAADRAFSALRRDLTAVPVAEPRVAGEVASLEASLRTDQLRLADAADLLDRAVHLNLRAGNRDGLARALIKRANLARREDQHGAAEEHLNRAAELLDPAEDVTLYVYSVGARALCLCDLGRFDEAEDVLDAHHERFQDDPTRWNYYLLLDVRGRIALGRGDRAAAEEAMTRVHDGALELGRYYDAALAALDLAHLYLEAGRYGELRELAAGLLVTFRSRGVPQDILAAIRLLHEALTAPEVDRARLQQVRRLLQPSVSQQA